MVAPLSNNVTSLSFARYGCAIAVVRLYRAMPLACVPSFVACGLRLFVANDYLTQKHKAYKIK